MDDILASTTLSDGSNIHIATLSRKTIVNSGAEHLGFDGYFLFEAIDRPEVKGISVLAKVASLDAAFRLIDLWDTRDRNQQNPIA
ncbi:hypothetical protein TH3_17395 [Thalassospira xiamenensis M-5 = DSM 17429]|uniref:Uncharacterized protein n=1 Tax=Thalassospira xiamenensis M-5 = DSM 17429 TaxID=1123366 RepID=A0AB72UGS9_9PROT|nr:hypothetical protein [Thalassospira xiamenensis]AJD53581.1 hypothetical protein TH3_17395 [Thalassospira xiamenensis M-5 = DSM 17429]